jgi:hypothetical protein
MTSGIYSKWPGDREMRACFCCRFRPKDGLTAYSTIYLDGLPPDPTAPQRIEAPSYKALPAGQVATADLEFDVAIQQAAKKLAMPSAQERTDQFARILKNIVTPPQDRPMPPPFEPISEARRAELQIEIDQAMQEQKRRGSS